MDLGLTRKVLATVEGAPYGFLKLRGRQLAYEVEQMQRAGFLELSAAENNDPNVAIVKSMTDSGHKLLRVLRRSASSLPNARTEELEICVL